jgi:hypothetical protein
MEYFYTKYGVCDSMYFLRESVLVYTPSPDINAPTVITVPATWQYADTGYDVTLAPAELATWTPGNGRIKSIISLVLWQLWRHRI